MWMQEHRLREKVLFGCIVQSRPNELKPSCFRHLHPNEVNMLNGFDPIIDFGPKPRLTLAAAGQMASLIQAAWVFAALDERFQSLHGCDPGFDADARVIAYAAWPIMRGRRVWPGDLSSLPPKLASLVLARDPNPSLHEWMWLELAPAAINIAAVLDLLICVSSRLLYNLACHVPMMMKMFP